MTIKRKDFQKAAALIHEFQLKLSEDVECAELRDALNLALLHMQKYYRTLRTRLQTQDKTNGNILTASLRGLSPMTPFRDAPDRFQWKWINLDSPKLSGTLPADVSKDVTTLPDIIHAAKHGDNEVLMQIIDADDGAVLELDGLGRTAVIYATHFGHLDTLQILLEQGADVNSTAHDGSTAVHRACHDGNHEVLRLLIEFQADLSVQDVQGRAPVHWACATKNRHCLSLLLQEGVSTGVRDKEGMSPSMWACRMDHIEHFELLSSADNQDVLEDDGFERDNNGRTWMHWSVRRVESLECLKTILTQESACLRDDEGKTVMHISAEQGSVPAAKVILEIAGKSCLEHRDAANRTPLIMATISGHGELINYLLAEGADLASVDNNAATAWDYARGRQLHYCMLIIASYIRQRAQEEGRDPAQMMPMNGDHFPPGLGVTMGSTLNGTFPSEMGDTADDDHLGLRQLQINGENEEVIYYGNRPIAPPHPPPGPPTPRTPRGGTTPRPVTPSTPRSARGTTPRGYGLKRSPSTSVDNANEEAMCDASDREVSAGSKRKRVNTEAGPDQDGHMSVMSMDSADMHPHSQTSHHSNGDVSAAEPEMANESQYLEQCGPHGNNNNQEVDSVSIGEMDVSDMGSDGGRGDEERPGVSPTAPVQPPQPTPRYQLGPPASPTQGGGGQHYYPSYPPHPPKTPPYHAHSPGKPPPPSPPPPAPFNDSEDGGREEDEEDDEEEEGPEGDDYHHGPPTANDATPMGEPRNGPLGASMHHNQDGRVIPPAHLLPLDLPPHGPAKIKKKKKKRRERSQSHDGLSPARGYAAPVNPPQGGSAGRDRTAPHQPGGAGDASGPGSAGGRERSPHGARGGVAPTPKPRDRSPAGQQGPRAQSMKAGRRRSEEEQRSSH